MASSEKDLNEESIILQEEEEEVDNPEPKDENSMHIEEDSSSQEKGILEESQEDVSEQTASTKMCSNIISQPLSKNQEISALRMHLAKEQIEAMINDGSLEKVSEGYYKMKAEKLKDLKICSELSPNIGKPLTQSFKSSLSKKPIISEASTSLNTPIVSVFNTPAPVTAVIGASSSITTPQLAAAPFVHQAPSYIALMPVNQPSSTTRGNTLLALPVQQNAPVSYNPSLPTFVALPSQNISTTPNVPQVISVSTGPVTTCGSSNVTYSLPQKPLQQTSITVPSTSTSATTPPLHASSKSSTKVKTKTIQSTSVDTPETDSSLKRKAYFEPTKVRRPYKYAKPLHKKRKKSNKDSDFVSDLNTSEEEDQDNAAESRAYGQELASMFFKKIGEPSKNPNKSLLDKLHKAIFDTSDSDTDNEFDEGLSESVETAATQVRNKKNSYQCVTCPGPGTFEAYVGPGQHSKLSIIRSNDSKMIKNLMYEVYQVRVTSTGREANTNILIPIPEGYRFQPPKGKEEFVEFSHVEHEDRSAANHISPQFLEKLASTELKLRKYKDEIKVLRRRYLELLREYANRPQFSTLSDLVGAAAKFLTEDQLVFFLMQLKAGAHNMQGIRYSVREKVLALSIYQRSPEVYKWFRKVFNLPSKRVLDQWLEDVALQDPQLLKKLMYYVYTTYNFKAVS